VEHLFASDIEVMIRGIYLRWAGALSPAHKKMSIRGFSQEIFNDIKRANNSLQPTAPSAGSASLGPPWSQRLSSMSLACLLHQLAVSQNGSYAFSYFMVVSGQK